MTNERRVWEMYGHQTEREVWVAIGSEFYVRIHGYGPPPVPVTVAEDPEGEYMGWIDFSDDEPHEPSLIQHKKIFNIQFPYGYQAEVKRNRGEAIQLTITVRDVQEN